MRRSMRERAETAAKKMQGMSLGKKISYLFTYYKGWLLALVVVFLFGFYVGDVLVQRSREIVLQGFFTNDVDNCFPAAALEKEVGAALGLKAKQRVVFDDSLYVDQHGEATEYSAASNSKIVAYVSTGELDFVVTNRELLEHFQTALPMADLKSLLPEELFQVLEPYMVTVSDEEGNLRFCALDLRESRYLKDRGAKETYYLFVPQSAPHKSVVIQVLLYSYS